MDASSPPSDASRPAEYVVVARRYRPQTFTDLVGQEQVSLALSKAIESHRVGHAYLFTGARGVGKTSTARILAKALNCEHGPTPAPCNRCEICQSVTAGEDVDVIEIDGASARGIDEIRQLRSNVNVRPSRSRFKIYIIDEVHMFTREAFNALLKTLEEPPEHVKFIFCTTDPEKIPITVLSRCQRFDFPPVQTASIAERLRTICEAEGVQAEPEALQLLARRAAGSMRDSQSLLEQLLSFCQGRIAASDVHKMLGTARGGSLARLAEQLVERQADGALATLETALREGVDAGQLAEQLLAYLRDILAAAVGCGPDLLLQALPDDLPQLQRIGRQWGVETVLAAIQVLDQAIVRMRESPHVRTLLEVALVRITRLSDLEEIARLVARLQAGGEPPPARPAPAGAEKKTADRTAVSPPTAPATVSPTTPTPTATAASASAFASAPSPPPAKLEPPVPSPVEPAAPPIRAADAIRSTPPAPAPVAARPVAPSPVAPTPVAAPLKPAGSALRTLEAVNAELESRFAADTPGLPDEPDSFESEYDERPVTVAERSFDGGDDWDESAGRGASTTGGGAGAGMAGGDALTKDPTGVWRQVIARLADADDLTADLASKFKSVRATSQRLQVEFLAEYNKNSCERPDRFSKLVQTVAAIVGRHVQLEFSVAARTAAPVETRSSAVSRRQLWRELEKHPWVMQAKQMFDAEIVDVQEPRKVERPAGTTEG